jgi:hypothetical protein
MAVVGCYDLNLYCDFGGGIYGENCPNKGFTSPQFECTGRNERECLRQAREFGWTFRDDNTKAICPKCSRLAKPKQ